MSDTTAYPFPWLEFEDINGSSEWGKVCPKCNEQRSLNGSCWCSEFGPSKWDANDVC